MRKSLILALTLLGSSVSYGAGVARIGEEAMAPDPATWRWRVSAIIDGQKLAESASIQTVATNLGPLYQRYTMFGLPERQ